MVATSQPLAAQAGLNILRRGGNAIDAAIATMATLCVVEPCSTGIGGDAFALIWNAREQKLYGINGSGPAPQTLDIAALRAEHGNTMPTVGGAAVTVPGSVRAWQLALETFGTRGLDTLLADAIDYAENGLPVSPVIARAWAASDEKIRRLPDSARVWLPNGKTPAAAERFRNPEFAATLRTIANDGYDAFYTGPIAAQIAQAVQADGGYLSEADLASYQAEWVDPIAATYTNSQGESFEMHEIPPNGQGLTALLALNIVDGLELRRIGYGSVDYYHALIEATKLAFADAAHYIADPKHAAIPLDALLSIDYAYSRRQQIDFARAQLQQPGNPNQHSDTVYLTTADGEGNMVSWIQSLYMGFGSGITAGTTGVQLQNRGANFTLEAGHANVAAPGKRPYHTIIPGFLTKNGQAWSSFGVMGGFMQPQGHLQVGLNMMEFGMLPQDALDAPRFNWQKDNIVALETAVASGVQGALARRGHVLADSSGRWSYGGGQVIVRRPNGILLGGTEPRKDGVVAAY
jgi:gamma-glutamyltranspeptidase/glutathione hydrolase